MEADKNEAPISPEDNSHKNNDASSASTEQGGGKSCLQVNEGGKLDGETAEAISQHNLRKKLENEKQHSWKSPSRIGQSIFRQTEQGEIRPAGASVHPMANKNDPEMPLVEEDDASWWDVVLACCCHSAEEWFYISGGLVALMTCLYFFLLGLELLGTSFKVVGGCTAGDMLGSDSNPIAGVMIGIIATALLQSSSTTTAIIVSLVSGGLDVKAGIYMVFGANVGTSVTCMIVSLAHMGENEELERAFSSSSALYSFNMLTLILLFPVEVSVGYLYHFTKLMLPESVGEGEKWEGPIKKVVSPLGNRIIMSNKDLITKVSDGNATCDSYYPVHCDGNVTSHETCQAGLIGCDSKNDRCPVFFQANATKDDDMVSGWVMLVLSLFLLIFCLVMLVTLLRKMLLGASTRIIYKATSINEYLAMLIGAGVTILVQSSSITSSALVPLAGVGILKLEQMLPLIMGADIGTTVTALLAAMVSSKVEALQIALVHLFFNVTGVLIWYPIPFMRKILLQLCRKLGQTTAKWRQFPIFFIILMYFVFPLLLFGISSCFDRKSRGFTALGVFLVVAIVLSGLYFCFWWRLRGGRARFRKWVISRQRRMAAIAVLADDLDYLKCDVEYCKNEIGHLKDFAGIATIEEGKPVIRTSRSPSYNYVGVDEDDVDGKDLPPEEEDKMSLYASTQSKSWHNILIEAAHSVKSGSAGGAEH